jgi:hypothetical protein
MRELAGKTAFVTGGASGVGLALGRGFAQAGMKVWKYVPARVFIGRTVMLSFEFKVLPGVEPPDELEIYCDASGLDSLLAQLQLLKSGKTDHVHLMTRSWGGTHLDELPQRATQIPLRHVIIYRE